MRQIWVCNKHQYQRPIKVLRFDLRLSPNEEDGELRPGGAALGVVHVVRLGVLGAHDAVEVDAHVGELAVCRVGHVGRQHAGAHGRGVEHLHDALVLLRGLPPRRVPDALAVHLRRPQRLVQQHPPRRVGARRVVLLLVALERDAHHPRHAHVLDELGRGHADLEEQAGLGRRGLVERQRDARAPVAVQRPRRMRRAMEVGPDPAVEAREAVQRRQADAGWSRDDGERAERRAYGPDEPGGARRPVVLAALLRVLVFLRRHRHRRWRRRGRVQGGDVRYRSGWLGTRGRGGGGAEEGGLGVRRCRRGLPSGVCHEAIGAAAEAARRAGGGAGEESAAAPAVACGPGRGAGAYVPALVWKQTTHTS
jgi:hypothetical protein